MKVGDLIQLRTVFAERGIIIDIKCHKNTARKVALLVVLKDTGDCEEIWSSDMKVINEIQ